MAEVSEVPDPDHPEQHLRLLKIDPQWLALAIESRRLSPQDFDLCLHIRRYINAEETPRTEGDDREEL